MLSLFLFYTLAILNILTQVCTVTSIVTYISGNAFVLFVVELCHYAIYHFSGGAQCAKLHHLNLSGIIQSLIYAPPPFLAHFSF